LVLSGLNGPELCEGHQGSQTLPVLDCPGYAGSSPTYAFIERNQLIYIEFTVGLTYHEVRTSVKRWGSPTLGVQQL